MSAGAHPDHPDHAPARVAGFVDAWRGKTGADDETPILSAHSGHRQWSHLTLGDLRSLLRENATLRRQLDAAEAAPREVWLMDNERTRIHDTELGARAAAISSWVDANPDPGYAAPFSFIAIAPDGDTDVDCVELIAMGHTTGIYVTRMPVESSEPEPNPLESAVTEALADTATTPADPEPAPAAPPWLVEAGDD